MGRWQIRVSLQSDTSPRVSALETAEFDLGTVLIGFYNAKLFSPMPVPSRGLPSTMKSCHGFIKYTIEVFTVDDDQYESRGEKEIVVVAPIQEKFDVRVPPSWLINLDVCI